MRIGIRVVDHKPRVKDATVDDAALLELAHDRKDDLLLDFGKTVGSHDRRGAIGAHAAGVRALVAVEHALVVLRRRKKHGVLAIHEREDRTLLAVQELLDQHFRAGRAKLVPDEHVVNRVFRLLGRFRDDHALPCREAVGLDHDWKPKRRKRRLGGRRVGEHLGLAGRNSRRVHYFLRKALRALHARTGGNRPERGNAYLLERINESLHERCLGTDDNEIRMVRRRPRDYAIYVFRRDSDVRCNRRGSGVAGGAIEFMPLFILRKPPRNRVLASTASNNKYLHLNLHKLLTPAH